LRVRADAKDRFLDFAARSDRHGRFGNDNRIAVERRGDLFGRREHIGEIGVAIATP